jgi:deoxyribodipyrimidine photo-lyase
LGDLTPITALADWVAAHGLEQIVTHWTPTGPEAAALAGLRDVRVVQLRRGYDSRAWPRATHGFFRFRAHIPDLIAALGQP